MRSWADPSTSVATTLSITTSAATTAMPLPLLHRRIFAFAFLHLTKVTRNGQKSVRNQSETGQTQPLSPSLPCLFPHPPTRTPTPTPMPISTTTTATATASAAGTTVSFPDRFRTAQAYFAPKFEIECVHAWILTLITRLATTLSTTTPAATAPPPLPLVHLGISAFAFKSNWHESRWRVRNQSETGQTQPLSLSLAYSLTLLPELLRLLLCQFPLLLLLVLLLVLLVLLWVFRTVSGPLWNRMRSRMDPYSHY